MQPLKHVRLISQTPEHAQISNFQIKLEFTSSVIDRLLLTPRQQPWKIVPGEGTDTTDDIDTDIPGGLI